jgi:hypothetical protein
VNTAHHSAVVVRPVVVRYTRPATRPNRVRCGGGWRRLPKAPCSGNY